MDCQTATLTEIPNDKFQSCTMLIEIVFRINTHPRYYLRRIGSYAFGFCENFQRITNGLPLSLVELGPCAFVNCTSLQQDITIPRRVQLVHVRCFMGCIGITSVVFEHQSTDPVVALRFEAFGGCSRLRTVILPPNLPWIPRYCFLHCTRLTNIPIPNAVRVIAHCAFQQCWALQSIMLSENMTGIGYDAYWGCKSLETVVIKSSTVQFGVSIFHECPLLTTITMYPWKRCDFLSALDGPTSDNCNFRYNLVQKSQNQLAQCRRR